MNPVTPKSKKQLIYPIFSSLDETLLKSEGNDRKFKNCFIFRQILFVSAIGNE